MINISEEHGLIAGRAFEQYKLNQTQRTLIEALTALAPIFTTCKGMTLALLEEYAKYKERCLRSKICTTLVLFVFRRFVPVDSPQYNDYLMARWELTKELQLVSDMYDRAAFGVGLNADTRSSCQWMVSSVRDQNAEFSSQLTSILEARGAAGVK